MDWKIVNRRTLLRGAGLAASGLLVGTGSAQAAVRSYERTGRPATPDAAWAALRAGNRRWVTDSALHPHQDSERRAQTAQKQDPYAVVLSCIDSRVAPEIIFDAGLGDLFAVRSAAQTIDPLVTGAVEYGPVELGTPLVVVLGHQRCGAVTAASHALHEGKPLPGELQRIVTALRPAYERSGGDVDKMIRINTVDVVKRLKADSLLAPRIARGRLKVVGAYYSLDTGQVTRLI
ncbi:carbonic anhydrase [Streptosporangium sp. NPDC000396]|uniref:carbonic anhydrase n=1 Tax=Streptosporangium sp. NPDC000396 TaxID=3366185 RepID=UPI0036C42EBA